MRVVVVDHVARLSGGEIALVRVAAELARSVDLTVVLGEDGPLVAQLRDAGADVHVLPMDPSLRDRRRDAAPTWRLSAVLGTVGYALRLARLLRRLQADVVHTNSLKAGVYGGLAGRLARTPVLWHARDRVAPDYLPRRTVTLVRLLSRVLATGVVANSAATLQTLPRGRHRVYDVVPDCVALVDAAVPERDGPLVFGVVGRLAAWKGQDVFLRAFAAAFAGTRHRARLVGAALFGEEAFARSLQELIAASSCADQVELRGFVADVDAEYGTLDVLVHCSIIPEPFGQVVLEGMAHGLPVIATQAGGPAELITPGVDGLLVPPGDERALAAAMQRLAADAPLRQRLGGAARETARRYPPARTAAGLVAAYAAVGRR